MRDELIRSKIRGHVHALTGNGVEVQLEEEGCSVCSKGLCYAKGTSPGVMSFKTDGGFSLGEPVIIRLTASTGSWAVFLFYGLPFLLMTLTLMAVLLLTGSEGWAGLSALVILVPYYVVLARFRDWSSGKCDIEIEKP